MTYHESWVERQIREATERGEFDNLQGAGKPLPIAADDDPDWWVKGFLDREGLDMSASMPPVLQLRAEHGTYPESLVEVGREEQVREILNDYNRRVVDDRLRPVLGKAMPVVAPLVDVEAMVEAWRERRSAMAPPPAAPSSSLAREASSTTSSTRRSRWWGWWRSRQD